MRLCIFLFVITFGFADESGLQSRNVEVRARAISAMGSSHSKENFVALYKHYQKMNTIEKAAYMKVLGRWQGEQRDKAMGLLINTLLSRRESRQVKIEAAMALGEMAHHDSKVIDDKKAQKRVSKIVKALKKGLLNTRDSYQVRESIIQAFTQIGSLEHMEIIATALKDKYQTVRSQAIMTFRTLNAVDHVKILMKAFKREKYATIQQQYIETIFYLNKTDGFPLFAKILNNRRNDNFLRIRLIEIIASYNSSEFSDFHKKAVKCLVKCYPNETDLATKKAVIRALSNFDISQPSIRKIYAITQKERDVLRDMGREYLEY